MGKTAIEYRDELLALLPRGHAWASDPESVFGQLLYALADELARIDNRADMLIIETDARSTSEMLDDFERMLGLPRCPELEQSTTERRNAVVATIQAVGGGSVAYLTALAAAAGYSITIQENTPDIHTFSVNAPVTTVTEARVGVARVGDRLRTWGNEALDCLLQFYKPAHLTYQITFGGP